MIYVLAYFMSGIAAWGIVGFGVNLYLRRFYHPAKLKAIFDQIAENADGLVNPFDILFIALAWPIVLPYSNVLSVREVKKLGGKKY